MKMKYREAPHRHAVGGMWQHIGSMQFDILKKYGLKPENTLLDIGCGSLRGGVYFIPYLSSGNYYGIEANKQLTMTGIEKEMTPEIMKDKIPVFDFNSDFLLSVFEKKFDFLLAQSIFSHVSPSQMQKIFEQASQVMHSESKFLATFFEGEKNYTGTEWTGLARYKFEYLCHQAASYSMTVSKLPDIEQIHPRKQTWILIKK